VPLRICRIFPIVLFAGQTLFDMRSKDLGYEQIVCAQRDVTPRCTLERYGATASTGHKAVAILSRRFVVVRRLSQLDGPTAMASSFLLAPFAASAAG